MPETRKSPAGNGAQSESNKAASLPLMVAQHSDLTGEDRLAAFVSGYEQGKAERIEAEIENRARALLLAWSNESRDMATHYARAKGPAWAAMVGGSE